MMGELERTARRIAAEMMGLVKDPEGLRLPDDLWQQAIPRAEKECEGRFMAAWPDEAQHTINELHNALWLALKASDNEIVVTPEELAEWGEPKGNIEWLTDPNSGIKIIRLVETTK